MHSPYGPEECAERLRNRLDRERSEDIIGDITARRVKLRYRTGSPEAQNTWFPMLSGTLVPDGDGTRIECFIGVSRFLAPSVAGLILVAWIISAGAIVQNVVAAVFPLGATLFLSAMHLLGTAGARQRGRQLLYFLSTMVDARERNINRAEAIEDLWRNG
ncbi:hypothetical protein [Dongia sp.]|uniref:hypothetical protein n=1 Tax=Dongia sp. TaxID=1977262 RepID=UPI00375306AA